MKVILMILLLALQLAAEQSVGNVSRLEIPTLKGVLEVNVGASPWYLEFSPQNKETLLYARQRGDGVIVTAELRQVTFAASSDTCKSELWPEMKKDLGNRIDDVREGNHSGSARVEYTFHGIENTNSHHLLAYWGARDLCAQVHLLKVGFTANDEKAFEDVVASVRLLPDGSGLQAKPGEENSSNVMAEGNEEYAQSHYGKAEGFYEKAFDLEKQNRTFDKDLFVDLISRLAFCKRMKGDLVPARELLRYGLSQDSEYPVFHYELACVDAELGNAEESLAQLREAYKNNSKASSERLPPDPEEDSCFQQLAQDPRFKDAVKTVAPPSH